MSNDRELLEMAARAAGVEGWFANDAPDAPIFVEPNNRSQYGVWNPLTDDGDALRLAVKLKLIVTFADGGAGPHICAGKRLGPFSNEPLPILHFLEQHNSDLSATRRAIVRAAAAIGRAQVATHAKGGDE